MRNALLGRPNQAFEVPPGVTFADVDRTNGKLATPECPATVHEAFLAGTEPQEICDLHGGVFRRLGNWFRRIIR
jgi:membrane carboxypeptidase/penicillin-binding protein